MSMADKTINGIKYEDYPSTKQEALEGLRIKESYRGAMRCHVDNYFPNLAGYNPTHNNAGGNNEGICAILYQHVEEDTYRPGLNVGLVVGIVVGGVAFLLLVVTAFYYTRGFKEAPNFAQVSTHDIPSAPPIDLEPGADLLCPITLTIMEDPVICSDGFSYERNAIEAWLKSNCRSPKTNQILSNKTLIPNKTLKATIISFREKIAKL